jgi:hypothetical protein
MLGVFGRGSLDLGDRPHEPGELAGDRDRDDRAALAAGFEAGLGAVQSLLRGPRDRDSFWGLIGLALGQGLAEDTEFSGGCGVARRRRDGSFYRCLRRRSGTAVIALRR